MRFVFLGPVFCLQLPSDSASPRTPLLLANLYFCLRGSGLAPYSSYACRAHIKKLVSAQLSLTNLFYFTSLLIALNVSPFATCCISNNAISTLVTWAPSCIIFWMPTSRLLAVREDTQSASTSTS